MTTEAIRLHSDDVAPEATREGVAQPAETPVVRAMEGLIFLTGLYLAISPWVVGFNGFRALSINDLIVGIALAVLSLGFASGYDRLRGLAWVTPLIGIWAIIAPWVVSGDAATPATLWSNIVAGVITAVFGLGAMAVTMTRTR